MTTNPAPIPAQSPKERVLQVWPKAYHDFPGNGVRIRQGVYPNEVGGWGATESEAWADAASRLTTPEPPVCPKHDAITICDCDLAPEPQKEATVTEIAHTLWYRGGRLRSELRDALNLHPENWHIEGLERMLDQWDEIATIYASKVLLAPPVAPEGQDGWISVENPPPLIHRLDREKLSYSEDFIVAVGKEWVRAYLTQYDGKPANWSSYEYARISATHYMRINLPAPPERISHDS